MAQHPGRSFPASMIWRTCPHPREIRFEILLDGFWLAYYSIAVLHSSGSDDMAMSVRLDATLETRVAQESRRLGITKSEFVKDALERVLGLKNPADLLRTVRSGKATGNPQASRNVSARMKAKLRAKLPD
jgi:predicted DNA-binding protein